MNVNDVQSPSKLADPTEIAKHIYQRQSLLEDRYWVIEKRPAKVIDINTREGQVIVKDFLWRITEEIGEALEARMKSESAEKIFEELVDGLHFVAGLCVILDREDFFIRGFIDEDPGYSPSVRNAVTDWVCASGILGNTLKMKPWKQTDIPVDYDYFSDCLKDLVAVYKALMSSFDLYYDSIWDYYYRKSEVNLFRIRSNY